MHPALTRRHLLQSAGLAGAVLLTPARFARALSTGEAQDAPQTGFEQRNGESWTTHAEELTFLDAVAAGSKRVRIEQIATTSQGRPMHLVTVGAPGAPDPIAAQASPITLFVGSQHGNEPAGRETALKLLRDLAFTQDEVLVQQLREQTVLFIPSANPDGRAANTRANAKRVDINRDHLNLTQIESRAIAAAIRDHNPDLVLDLHEYGPSVPVVYDDDVLYLWPRNLNADGAVRDLSRTLCEQYIKKGCETDGYTADEYGLFKVGANEITQTAGNEDEGICRNAMGLRHALGILVESAVSQSVTPARGVDEVTSEAARNRRRVASQMSVGAHTLRFMREQGEVVKFASDSAPGRKTREGAERSAPVYFAGADNDPPAEADMLFPPPSAYRISAADHAKVADAFALHGIRSRPEADGTVLVTMAQPAEPVIPLLLDARGKRHAVKGTPVF